MVFWDRLYKNSEQRSRQICKIREEKDKRKFRLLDYLYQKNSPFLYQGQRNMDPFFFTQTLVPSFLYAYYNYALLLPEGRTKATIGGQFASWTKFQKNILSCFLQNPKYIRLCIKDFNFWLLMALLVKLSKKQSYSMIGSC